MAYEDCEGIKDQKDQPDNVLAMCINVDGFFKVSARVVREDRKSTPAPWENLGPLRAIAMIAMMRLIVEQYDAKKTGKTIKIKDGSKLREEGVTYVGSIKEDAGKIWKRAEEAGGLVERHDRPCLFRRF
jgi:hypothetical protein